MSPERPLLIFFECSERRSQNNFWLESNNTWTGVGVESVEASASCVTLWRTARFCYFLAIVPQIASGF